MTPDVTRADVLAWLAATGGQAAEAVDHFWPGLDGDDRRKKVTLLRQWMHRAKPKSAEPQGEPGTDGAVTVERPPPDLARVALERVPFLEWHLGEVLADLALVRQAGIVGRVSQLTAQVTAIRAELDTARGEAGRTVVLERSPAAVAEEIEVRQSRINQLAAASRAARERNL